MNCQNAACSGKLTWIDGTSFVWAEWMADDFNGGFGVWAKASCMFSVGNSAKVQDQFCTHFKWGVAVCQKSCV